MKRKSPFLLIGLTGFLVTTVLFIAFMAGGLTSGREFWMLWFPSYLVWVVFMIIGMAKGRQRENS